MSFEPNDIMDPPAMEAISPTVFPACCGVCGDTFDRRAELVGHLEARHLRQTCLHCGMDFVGKRHIAKHVECMHLTSPCTLCGAHFNLSLSQSKHFEDEHVAKSCTVCLEPVVDLLFHFDAHHGQHIPDTQKHPGDNSNDTMAYFSRQLTCMSKPNRPLHERIINNGSRGIPATKGGNSRVTTGKKYEQILSRKFSIVEVQKLDMLHKCPRCTYTTTQKSNLLRHVEAFHINYKCRECDKPYLGRKAIYDHVRHNHPGRDKQYTVADVFHKTDHDLLKLTRCSNKVMRYKENFTCCECSFKTAHYSAMARHKCEAMLAATSNSPPRQTATLAKTIKKTRISGETIFKVPMVSNSCSEEHCDHNIGEGICVDEASDTDSAPEDAIASKLNKEVDDDRFRHVLKEQKTKNLMVQESKQTRFASFTTDDLIQEAFRKVLKQDSVGGDSVVVEDMPKMLADFDVANASCLMNDTTEMSEIALFPSALDS